MMDDFDDKSSSDRDDDNEDYMFSGGANAANIIM
jgi:hypothetical protein